MKPKVRKNGAARASIPRRGLAVLVALCLLLGQVNGGFIVAYATSGTPVSFNVGTGVTAELSDGVLTLSGTGDTDDFTAETAPFSGCAGEIRTLVIEEGVTYLGAHLFSGLGELGGTLTLPSSIVGFGDQAFSGGSAETSPHFSEINNLFESGEVVRPAQPEPVEAPAAEDAAPATEDPAAQDASNPEAPVEEAEPAPETPAPNDSAPADLGYTVEQVVQQTIAHPETLFFPGQTGTVTCSDANESFLGAALSAGYERAGASTPAAVSEEAEEPQAEASAQADEGAEVSTVYVDQAKGNDDNNGTSESPVKTLDAAANLLTPRDNGGSVETNRIVILGTTYKRLDKEKKLFETHPVPVTISGETPQTVFTSEEVDDGDHPLDLYEDLRFESITVESINHIYANGCSLTFGKGVTVSKYNLYLYGFGKGELLDNARKKSANLTVESGDITRIVGYVRSNEKVNCEGYTSTITIGGTANVGVLVAGNASGAVKSADVGINIKDGHVNSLLGGNQGFNTTSAPFSGKSSINISGGTVKDLYGAGTGRNLSVPTFEGELNIGMTGGKVNNLYGAGSAAYVVGGDATTVDVSVSGGQVENLFVAGKGWDSTAGLGKDSQGKEGEFVGNATSDKFGSFTGVALITVDGNATVGNIYASGEGVSGQGDKGTKSNAYLNGKATIKVNGGTVTGNIYGGGKGVTATGYDDCARVTKDSDVRVIVAGGTVQGNVYGGGQIADVMGSTSVTLSDGEVQGKVFGGGALSDVEGSTSVTLSGGTVQGNVYGGGEKGVVKGATVLNIQSGTVNSSAYGGALGSADSELVLGGSTVNMTGGWVRGNLYGGSEFSNDGKSVDEATDRVFTNLVGGTVSGNVFGGGYQGIVNGSTHLHIGVGALAACTYYSNHKDNMPVLTPSSLSVGRSVYAGGDFGGDGADYDAITVTGTSHVYIDGTGYDTSDIGDTSMSIAGGVFGSGASCDAGKTRLVTLKNWGQRVTEEGAVTGATRTLAAIQRADRVLLINSHVKLLGQSDVANTNQTALYSLNRIGDHGDTAGDLGSLGNGLVLQDGSTLALESPATELAAFRSVDNNGKETTLDAPSNTLLLDTGTLLRVSYTTKDGTQQYGPVKGYTKLLAGNSAEGYVYARTLPAFPEQDGGFVDKDSKEIGYTDVESANPRYRYWQVSEGGANATRQVVLTAQTLKAGDVGYGSDFSVASGIIELPPADANSVYTVKSVEVSNSALKLVEAAKTGQGVDAGWRTSSGDAVLENQQTALSTDPLSTFGLFMKPGTGFTGADVSSGKIVSAQTIVSGNLNTIIGKQIAGSVSTDHVVPQIEFYLTYYNDGITASQDLGTVTIVLERAVDGTTKETTTANVQIVTRTTDLSSMSVDLYATQTGSYTGKLYIPSGATRKLTLARVEKGETGLVKEGSTLQDGQFSISMRAGRSQGWRISSLMDASCDLGALPTNVDIGTTDSRYEAPIEFTLTNAANFSPKALDVVKLALKDEDGSNEVPVELRVHWEESPVSAVKAAAGRQYNGLSATKNPFIAQRSAITAVFTLSKSIAVKDSRIELQDNNGTAVLLPTGTEVTLLNGTQFYRHSSTGTDVRIGLEEFALMDGSSNLAGSINGNVIVILDLGPTASGLAVGEYSLRLRNQEAADSTGAGFTVDNSVATASIDDGDGPSKGEHTFALSLLPGSDTRFQSGAAVVLSPGDGGRFPEGTVFVHDGTSYYPSNGKVHIPLSGGGPWDIVMDTSASRGLSDGLHSLSAEVFPVGANAGNASALLATTSYNVGKNPSYGLSVSLGANAKRIVEPGSSLSFTASYAASANGTISVSAQKKTNGGYEGIGAWQVSGNDALAAGSGTQTIAVTVPSGLDPGTYRLLFKLGDQEVPYNLIVSE